MELLAHRRGVKWDHCRDSWGLNILIVEEGLKMGGKSLCCSTNMGYRVASRGAKTQLDAPSAGGAAGRGLYRLHCGRPG